MIWGQEPMKLKCDFIDQNFLHLCQDRTVLEIGCFHGWVTERVITHNPKKLILLESYVHAVNLVRDKFLTATVIHGDMHEHADMQQVGKVDVALMLGVIYHSHAPLQALEKLVILCEPQTIILDNMQPFLDWKEETANTAGMRNTVGHRRTCNIIISIPNDLTIKAMHNLGYDLITQETYPEPAQGWGNPIFHFERRE
jgi:hypothetical protein